MRGMSSRSRVVPLVLLATLGALAPGMIATPPAWAAPTSAESAEAKSAWEKGRQAAQRKKWSAAVDAFRDADVLDPKVQYKLDLARALVALKKLREASEVLDEIDASKEPNTASVRGAANTLRQKVEQRLATIVVAVTGARGAVEVDVDGEKVKAGDAVRLDPGEHLVKARAPGYVPMEQTLVLKEGQTEEVSFRLERDPAAASADAEEEEEEPAAPAPEEPDGGGTLLPAAIAWGAGGVALGLGALFGVLAFDEAEKARVGCVDNVCPNANKTALDASKNNGVTSTVFFVVGGVGVATGVVLALVFAGGDDAAPAPSTARASVRPWFGASELGVEGRF